MKLKKRIPIAKPLQINNTDVCASMLIKKLLLSNYSITTQILEHRAAGRFMALETLGLTQVYGVQWWMGRKRRMRWKRFQLEEGSMQTVDAL